MKISSLFKLLAASSLLAMSAQAADIFLGARTQVSSNNANFDISVFDGNAGYNDRGIAGAEPGTPTFRNPFGDGTIVDYNFVGNEGTGSPLTTYASGAAGLIPTPTAPPENVHGNGEDWANVWTTNDPGSSMEFSDSVKNHNPGVAGAANTFARAAEVDGTIDISSLNVGTVYFPHGTFVNQWSITVTMSGPGQDDIVAMDSQDVNGEGTNFGWISEFNFSDAGDYTTISYNYTNADRDGSRARFMGVILEGSSETNVDDTDGDLLPDLWEDENFGNNNGTIEPEDLSVSDGTGDVDGDGATDRQEFLAGSDPNNKDTDGDTLEDGPEINIHGSDPTKTDTDGDTLSDDAEVNIHMSDPALTDTDGDTLTDDEEVVEGTDGFVTSPSLADTDDDGVRDDVDTDPIDPTNDNDGDGLGNRDERDIHMTDPLVADSDGDSILDGEEVEAGADGFITNPNDADTDADGYSDAIEVAGGSDPTNVDSVPGGVSNIGLIERVQVSSNNANFDISVFPGSAGYNDRGMGGAEPGVPTFRNLFGEGTVLDYNFIGNEGTGSALTTYASGEEGLIPTPTAPSENVHGNGEEWSNVWTTNDPGPDLEFTGSEKNHNPGVPGAANTFARCADVTGTVDISGIRAGTLYIPHGTFINQWTLTMTMSGPGQPDIVAIDTQDVNGPGTNFGWITSFNFVNKAGYDTITYHYTNADRDGSRARFMGVILVADGGSKGLEITDITHTRESNPDNIIVDLTFNSREGRQYSIFNSSDLALPIEQWNELDDSFDAAVGTDSTTFTVNYLASGLSLTDKQFFVIIEN
jgi:hypothetical protein